MVIELLWVLIGGAFLGGSALKDAHNRNIAKYNPFWWTDKHFDIERQTYYKNLCLFEKGKAEKLLGHPLENGTTIDLYRPSVEEFLKREGIDYYDSRAELENWKRAAGYNNKRRW